MPISGVEPWVIDITVHSSDDLPRFESCKYFLKISSPRAQGTENAFLYPQLGVFPRMRTKILDLITHTHRGFSRHFNDDRAQKFSHN